MLKMISLGLMVGGVVLALYGFNATQSLASDISRFFTGSPTDKAIWMLLGGIGIFLVGFIGITRRSRAAE